MESLWLLSALYFAVGAVCLFLALWSRNPKHLGTAVGTLEISKKVMRRASRYSDKKIPVTTSRYIYQVNGKTYRLRYDTRSGRRTLLPRMTVVYLRGFPRFGHPDKYPSGQFTILGTICIIGSLMFLLMPYF